jgi:hypothetical protein
MPTESEFDKYNRPLHIPEIKPDHQPRYRLAFLDRVNICWACVTIRTVLVYGLALYGLYSLITQLF